ncbi:MAG: VWA domain-containing protein [Acidobacteriota bacterium]|nr:VWA domain-containing protein [Acidobacteriota bacterium]
MRAIRASLIAVTVLALGSSAAAQAPPQAPAQQPVFKSGTAVVEVTVIVRNPAGGFIRDLTIADFEVREGGVPQQIQTVYLVEGPATRAPGAAPDAPAPGLIATPAARRAFVFLVDLDHLSPGGLTRAREAVETFASTRLLRSDLSSVVALGSANGRISNDHRAMLEAVATLKPRADRMMREQDLRQWPRILSPSEALAIIQPDEQEFIRIRDRACAERQINCTGATSAKDLEASEGEGNRETVEQELKRKATSYVAEARAAAARSIHTLAQVAGVLERIPGRKTVVWLTEATWSEEIARTARETAHRAAQSGVVVYTIDPRGLGRSAGGNLDGAAPAEAGQAFLQDQDDIANVMANDSGGRAIRNENNLTRALSLVEDDTSTYYVVGYAPADAGDRTKPREIDVRVTRAGLDARVRHGFMAPQRTTALTAPAPPPEPAPVAAPAPAVSASPDVASPPDAGTERMEPTEPAEPAVPLFRRPDADARVTELSAGVDTSGRDTGREGWQAYQSGDVEAALPLLQRAAARPGAASWVYYALGFSYIGVSKPKEAIAAWERVLALAPEFTPVYLDLATTYSQLKDYNGALSVLRAAARRWPADAEIRNGMGVVYIRRGSLDEAVEAFQAAVTAEPGNAVSWLNLGRAYELRFMRDRRWVASQERWIGDEDDRSNGKKAYERAVTFGGPYGEQAQEALQRLSWSDK